MKIVSLLIVLMFLFSVGAGVVAQATELPDPGLTPDSRFYFLERIGESIRTFFTFGDLKKAERHAALAAERLAEAQSLVEKGKLELVEKTLQRYEKQLDNSIARAKKAQAKGKNTEKVIEVLVRVGQATSKHLEVLAEVAEKVPESAKPAIEKAMKASLKGHTKAVEMLKAKDALGEIPEQVSLPAKVPQEVRERVEMKVQQELGIEEALEGFESFDSLRDFCIEKGGPPEMCEQFPAKGFESFDEIEDFCIEKGGPSEICSMLEDRCREVGVTEPDECFLVLSVATFKTFQETTLEVVPLEAVPVPQEK